MTRRRTKDSNNGENPLTPILDAKDKDVLSTNASAGGLLARFWRTILKDLRVTPLYFADKLTQHLNAINEGKKDAASNAKGSYNRRLAANELTWNFFLEGLKILGVFHIEFSIKLSRVDGTKTEHTLNAVLMTEEEIKSRAMEEAKRKGTALSNPLPTLNEGTNYVVPNLKKSKSL